MGYFKKSRVGKSLLVIFILVILFTSLSTVIADEDEEEGGLIGLETETTGTLNYVLFGITLLIVPWRYFYRFVRKKQRDSNLYEGMKRFNPIMNKIHFLFGKLAFIAVIIHSLGTWGEWNIFVVSGLVLIFVFIITGALYTIEKIPGKIKGYNYKIHINLLFVIITAALLYLGHTIAD